MLIAVVGEDPVGEDPVGEETPVVLGDTPPVLGGEDPAATLAGEPFTAVEWCDPPPPGGAGVLLDVVLTDAGLFLDGLFSPEGGDRGGGEAGEEGGGGLLLDEGARLGEVERGDCSNPRRSTRRSRSVTSQSVTSAVEGDVPSTGTMREPNDGPVAGEEDCCWACCW